MATLITYQMAQCFTYGIVCSFSLIVNSSCVSRLIFACWIKVQVNIFAQYILITIRLVAFIYTVVVIVIEHCFLLQCNCPILIRSCHTICKRNDGLKYSDCELIVRATD